MRIGIQGGKGSYNEQVALQYVQEHQISDYEIVYLYTSHETLKALSEGNVDIVTFAIYNTLGRIVGESLEAMSEFNFQIVEQRALAIRHCMMKRKDIAFEQLTAVMAHPQVLTQCKHTLEKKYPHLVQKVGEGELVDTATAAAALADGSLDPHTAIVGPKGLIELFDFDVIQEDMQDDPTNTSYFIVAKKR